MLLPITERFEVNHFDVKIQNNANTYTLSCNAIHWRHLNQFRFKTSFKHISCQYILFDLTIDGVFVTVQINSLAERMSQRKCKSSAETSSIRSSSRFAYRVAAVYCNTMIDETVCLKNGPSAAEKMHSRDRFMCTCAAAH